MMFHWGFSIFVSFLSWRTDLDPDQCTAAVPKRMKLWEQGSVFSAVERVRQSSGELITNQKNDVVYVMPVLCVICVSSVGICRCEAFFFCWPHRHLDSAKDMRTCV